jgi:Putative metal-binding motif/Dictyostelium (slime mold) repeat
LRASRVSLLCLGACGSRTQFEFIPGPPECVENKDCEGLGDLCFPVGCVNEICQDRTPVNCDDANPCTTDSCDPSNGMCLHPPSTLDLDKDGHRAPLSGKAPGEPNSCGDDCDDTNAMAFPGGVEVCDGVDNDCNGVVDDGAQFSPVGDAILVSEGTQAHPQSLGYSGGSGYMSAYSAEVESRSSIYLQALSKTGEHTSSEVKFTPGPADAYGGPLVWTGDRYGIAWSDRRDARGTTLNYEVYFNIVNPDGTKRNADLRVTHEEGFSINVSVAWTGNEFVLVWEDDGMSLRGDQNLLFAQRIDVNGAPIGGNVRLIDDRGLGQTGPVIATGLRSLGVVWMRGDAQRHELMFAPFDPELKPLAEQVSLTGMMGPGVYPTIVHNQSEYVIAWYDPDSPKKTVYGAVRGELGEEIVSPRIITQGNSHARLPSVLPYGDRTLLIWSDDRDNNRGYELYAKMLGRKLEALTPEQRITTAADSSKRVSGSLDATTSFGPNGEVGVLFGDDRTGLPQVYFTHLNCVGSMAP